MVLMVLPPVVVRLFRPVRRESLTGSSSGLSARSPSPGCATLSRLAPQFATGLIAHNRPIKGLVVEATLHGITVPLTAAVAADWSERRSGSPARRTIHTSTPAEPGRR